MDQPGVHLHERDRQVVRRRVVAGEPTRAGGGPGGEEGQLLAYRYNGFFRAMDTLKDKQILEDMVERGDTPWQPKATRAVAAAE